MVSGGRGIMGYTHYWYRPKRLDEKNFSNAIKDIALLVSYTKFVDNYPDSWFGETPAHKVIEISELNTQEINFNGIGEQAHDTFLIALNDNENRIYIGEEPDETYWRFGMCKTSFENEPTKAYDKYVTACLYIFKYHLGDEFLLSSDGDVSDWNEGLQMGQDILGHPYNIRTFEFDESPKEEDIVQ